MSITKAKCRSYRCTRDPKWEAVEYDGRIVIACGVHGPGPDKRKIYGTALEWAPISAESIAQSIAVQKEVAEARAKDDEEKDAREHERQRDIAVIYWKRLADEPDYVLRYVEESRWGGKVVRSFVIYDSAYLAEWEAAKAERPEDYKYANPNTVATISLREESNWEDVTFPVDLRVAVSSNMTAKFVPVYAEALRQAAAMADAMNARLLEQHEEQQSRRKS